MGIVAIIFIAWYFLLKDYFDGKQKNIKLNFHTKKGGEFMGALWYSILLIIAICYVYNHIGK